ncbi:uncharacterized protein LOC133542624 [Nerophis ophidion]|uniref:uncharacterized protein LOC133542624 n=1 Tax=Nerophis ophidion TaxID=159077 RepID=UPI002ADF039D|nr:uncharacterized protein LOC133542624 [Nerophis ophidion]
MSETTVPDVGQPKMSACQEMGASAPDATGNICLGGDQSGGRLVSGCSGPPRARPTPAPLHCQEREEDVKLQLVRHTPGLSDNLRTSSGYAKLSQAKQPLPSGERPNHSTTSKVAYFKRKYAEEEVLHGRLRGYFQKHLILQEDRGCILKLSLEKLRFLDDPEAYLRRSVLINNLLRKIHHEEGYDDVEEEEGMVGEGGMYSDRKRLKVLVGDCCSPSLSLEELQRYRLVPCCPSAGCLCGLDSGPGLEPLEADHRLLLYNLDDHG